MESLHNFRGSSKRIADSPLWRSRNLSPSRRRPKISFILQECWNWPFAPSKPSQLDRRNSPNGKGTTRPSRKLKLSTSLPKLSANISHKIAFWDNLAVLPKRNSKAWLCNWDIIDVINFSMSLWSTVKLRLKRFWITSATQAVSMKQFTFTFTCFLQRSLHLTLAICPLWNWLSLWVSTRWGKS